MKTVIISLALAAAFTPVASSNDQAFVAKVSQGGAYEVAASKVAELRATAQDVKNLAVMEVHDHTLVGSKLKQISLAAALPIASAMNPEFTARLAKLKETSKADFDAAYIEDMQQIHDKDEKLFAQEAVDGSGAFQVFAAQTDKVVKRHIGALHGLDH